MPPVDDSSLVIFDLDGTLIDSEPVACRALAETLTAHDFPYDDETVMARFVGIAYSEILEIIEAEQGRALPAAFHSDIEIRVDQRFAAELRAIEGAAAMLEALRPARCLASNSPPDYIDRTLAQTGLDRHLPAERRFSAAMVARPKPAPDVFHHAARSCGATSESCVVIEDSEAGARGARAAGMTVLGFLGGGHIADRQGHAERLRAAGVREVFESLDRLPALLTAL